MKKMIGFAVLSLIGMAMAASAQAPCAPAAVETPAAAEAPVAAVAAPVAAVAEEITVKGEVSVVNGPDGALRAIYINPADPASHGYKVDIVNGEGKTLADKDGQIVEVVGVDANRLLNVKSVAAAE